ncbi:MAG: hypothetical protein H6742_10200 [Alphaproteobacteria bacterium]|nr:hypothetical protein [Alphaproteobacteria bacterium]
MSARRAAIGVVLLVAACAPDGTGGVRGRDTGPGADGGGADGGGGGDDGGGGDGTDDDPPAGVLGTLHEVGEPTRLSTWPTVNYRGTDLAWSAADERFLVVWGNAPIGGAFLDADAVQRGAGFRLTSDEYDGGNWTQNPRVVASDGGFLVSWHAETGSGPIPRVRRVRVGTDGPSFAGPEVDLAGPGAFQESAIALAFSPDSGQHLAVWAQDGLKARRLDGEGQPLGAVSELTAPGGWVEQPAAVYHPDCGCFFVTTMQEHGGGGRALLFRIEDGTGTVLGEAQDLSGVLDFAKVTDVTLDEARGEVVASWYEIRAGVAGFAAQRLAADGTATTERRTVFPPYGSYDGYDLAWSPVSGTCVASFHGLSAAAVVAELDPALDEGAAVELSAAGAANGVFLPRLAAHPHEPRWLVVGAPDYAAVSLQVVERTDAR